VYACTSQGKNGEAFLFWPSACTKTTPKIRQKAKKHGDLGFLANFWCFGA
jgi:hypothetical protein